MSTLETNSIGKYSTNNVSFDDALNLKSYTTAVRDTLTSVAGDTIYNTTTGKIEYYNGSAWQQTGASTFDCDFLIVAGGGGGSNGDTTAQGGGGGAGGYRNSYNSETSGGNSTSENAFRVVKGLNYTVTVGGAGAVATVGNDSIAFTTHKSTGGGNGGQMNVDSRRGQAGGSGGGAGSTAITIYGSGGSGSKYQGFRGGEHNVASPYQAGGGGGAGGKGGDINNTGGAGLASSITGSSVTRAAGGNGGSSGGAAPSANTGSGGEGRLSSSGATAGASGIVILRWATADATISVGAGLTSSSTTDGSDTVVTFTAGTGTVSWS